MAVVGPACRSNGRVNNHLNVSGCVSSSMPAVAHNNQQHQAILAAAQPFYTANPVNFGDVQPDRPIGYGAFGVVW